MPVYKLTAYPKEAVLRDGAPVVMRPMEKTDAERLVKFFQRIPAGDRLFLKEDVANPKVIYSWAENMNYDRALPLLALSGSDVVADAVLIRRRAVARQHVAEVRVVVHPEWRNKGLGSALVKELCDIAADSEIEKVIAELVSDVEEDAIAAFERLGFIRSAVVPELLRGSDGRPHDLVILTLPLGKWYQWWQY